MNEQMMSFKEKQKIIDDYLAAHDIYGKFVPELFDMRNYSKFVEKNNLKPCNITDDIMHHFESDPDHKI